MRRTSSAVNWSVVVSFANMADIIGDGGVSAVFVLAVDGASLGVFVAGIALGIGATVASEVKRAALFRWGAPGSPVSITSSVGGATTSGTAVAEGALSLAGSCLSASWLASAAPSRAMMTPAVASAARSLATVPERRCERVLRWVVALRAGILSLTVATSVGLSPLAAANEALVCSVRDVTFWRSVGGARFVSRS